MLEEGNSVEVFVGQPVRQSVERLLEAVHRLQGGAPRRSAGHHVVELGETR